MYSARRRKLSQIFDVDYTIDPLWCAWFSGLIDGEGCFSIRVQGKNSFSAQLKISMREDEEQVIKEIQSTLRCGFVGYLSNRSNREKGGLGRDAIAFRVIAINEICNIIIPLLDKFPLRTKKALGYNKWREAAILIRENAQFPMKREHMLELKHELEMTAKTRSKNHLNVAK